MPPADFGINGTLLFQDGEGMGLYTLGGTPYRQTRQLVDATQEAVVLGFSPSGHWLAYVTVQRVPERSPGMETPTMVLLSDTGERIERLIDLSAYQDVLKECCPFNDRFGVWYGYWLNDQLLYVEIHSSDSTASGMVSALPTIYDPFTETWYQWFEELPDRYEIGAVRIKGHEIGLSPDLSRVLYPVRSGGITLRDIPDKREIWSDSGFELYKGEFIRWSQDSQHVALANFLIKPPKTSLLIISREGNVLRIVNGTYPSAEFQLIGMNWSPDGRYLAIIGWSETTNLYLFDTYTSRYQYYCPMKVKNEWIPYPIWSPDSAWIALSANVDTPLYVMNVPTGKLYELLDNAIVKAWSGKFTTEWP